MSETEKDSMPVDGSGLSPVELAMLDHISRRLAPGAEVSVRGVAKPSPHGPPPHPEHLVWIKREVEAFERIADALEGIRNRMDGSVRS